MTSSTLSNHLSKIESLCTTELKQRWQLKLLVDPVYTTQLASRCSTFLALAKFLKSFLNYFPSSTAVLMIPGDKSRMDFDDDAKAILYDYKDRLILRKIHYSSDRYREIYLPREDLKSEIHEFGGVHGDWDVLLTYRNNSIFYRFVISQSSKFRRFLSIFDSYPMLPHKKTTMEATCADGSLRWYFSHMRVLGSYLGFDRVYLDSLYDLSCVRKGARIALSPAFAKRIDEICIPVKPVNDLDFDYPNRPEARAKFDNSEGMMEVFYIQRYTTTQKRADRVIDVFSKLYAMKDRDNLKMEFSVYTPSKVDPSEVRFFKDDHNFFFMTNLSKSEFRQRLRDGHVFVCFSVDEGGPTTLYEAFANACIGVIYKAEWTKYFLGDYPFYVKNEAEAIATVRWIYNNRLEAFNKWLDWYNSFFMKVSVALPYCGDQFCADVCTHFINETESMMEKGPSEFATRIHEDRDTFGDIVDILNPGAGKEDLRSGGWPKETPFYMLPQRWVVHFSLRTFYGWVRDRVKPWVLHRPVEEVV